MKKYAPGTLLLLIAVATVGATFAVDQAMVAGDQARTQDRLALLLRNRVLGIDERLNATREMLGSLERKGATDCGPASAKARDAAIAFDPAIADVAVLDATGAIQCSGLDVAVARSENPQLQPQQISPFETIETVLYGDEKRPTLRMVRHLADGKSSLAAMVPFASLFWRPHALVDDARMRLTFGSVPVHFLKGDPVAVSSEPTLKEENDAFDSSVVPVNRHYFEIADAAYPPLMISMTASEGNGLALTDPLRLVADISTFAAILAIGLVFAMRLREPQRLAARLDRAIRRNEFEPVYRPIIDVSTGRVSGVCVDLVWQAGKHRLESIEFMSEVIRTGRDLHLIRLALLRSRQNLAQAFRLRPRLALKLHVDYETLCRPQFTDVVRRTLVGSGIRLSQTTICVEELTLAGRPGIAMEALRSLQALGVALELRDSSLALGFEFEGGTIEVASVGLDRRLIAALSSPSSEAGERAQLWISQMVEKAERSGTRLCAYGVSSHESVRELKALNVLEIEGPVLAPVLSAGSFMALVARAGLDWHERGETEDVPAAQSGIDADASAGIDPAGPTADDEGDARDMAAA